MAAFLLDTNVLSEIVKPRPSPAVEAFLARHSDLWLSVIVLHELAYGAERVTDATRRLRLQTWIASVREQFGDRIIDVDQPIAETAGRLRAFSAAQGRALAPLDSLVAATAMVHAQILATRNTRDFDYLGAELLNPWEG